MIRSVFPLRPLWPSAVRYPGQFIVVQGNLRNLPLKAARVTVAEVRIEALRDETFYALVKITAGEAVHEIDARPSDALNLALIAGCPIGE